MRLFWILARVVLIVLALLTSVVTVLFVSGPSGTTVEPGGAVIDLIALVVVIACVASLWRDLRGGRPA